MTGALDWLWDDEVKRAMDSQLRGLLDADLNLDVIPRPVLTAKKISYWSPVSQALLDEQQEWLEGIRAFRALPPAEQQRIRDEQAAKAAADKLARTCEHCGCDPDEHGSY